ncbi:MAG TPA: diacylglycerol kinase family protein [Baekduia sp.]|nr:diacylglycerol kinase family protein [Baekduia sp.]
MRVLLATNERSGSGGAQDVAALLRAHGGDVRTCAVEDVAPELVDGAERVVVAGGDGSVGPAAHAASAAGVPLAVVAVGTANDFARAADLPAEPEEACALAVRGEARTARFEIGRMDGRPFVNVASAGLSVVAAREAHPLKPRLGVLAYAVGAVRAAVTHRPQPAHVVVDGREVFAGRAWQVVVAATGHFGGGSATGGTRADDRALDVLVVPASSRAALVWRAIGMRRGRLHAQDDVVHARGREVLVEGPRTYNVDGEVCPCGGTSRFCVDERLVDVVVPA